MSDHVYHDGGTCSYCFPAAECRLASTNVEGLYALGFFQHLAIQSLTTRFILVLPMHKRTRIKERHMKQTSMISRVAAFVILGAAISATLAFADDRPDGDDRPAVSSPPPLSFAPMTRSDRRSRYLGGLSDGG